MEYVRLGKTGLKVSRICLGTMHFGNHTPEDEAIKIMERALDMGINFWDTANVYSGSGKMRGASEAIIGRFFQAHKGSRDRVVLATKVNGPMEDVDDPNFERGISTYKVRKHVNDSLERLQTDRIDLYQMHHVERQAPWDEMLEQEAVLADRDELVEKAIELDPEYGSAYYSRAKLHAKLADSDKAEADIQMVTHLGNRNMEVYMNENNVWQTQHMHVEDYLETELER